MTNTYSQSDLLWSKDFTTKLDNYYSEYPNIQSVADTIEVIGRKNKLSFRIGREAEFMPTEKCTIISVPYHTSEDEIGSIAIIGPKRMDYAKVIPLMEYIAKNITKLYKK